MKRSVVFCVFVFIAAMSARAQTETLPHAFAGAPGDGTAPAWGSLITDSSGNLYGTTSVGGSGTGTDCSSVTGAYSGCGIVFELSPNHSGGYTEKILHNFNGTPDGLSPMGGLIMDKAGNLYGTTQGDGVPSSCSASAHGSVFELSPNGSGGYTERVLYSFNDSCSLSSPFYDGSLPNSTLITDSAGNLYGTTQGGGYCSAGTVFELVNSSGTWKENQLWVFQGISGSCNSTDGSGPVGGLVMDANGDLFGTTSAGGTNGQGAVFELVKSSTGYTEQVLYSFAGTSSEGGDSNAALIMDQAGDLYGTEEGNGGGGAVFELVKSTTGYTFKLLYHFTCENDGCAPAAPLIMDGSGNLYSTTDQGGPNGFGVVFEMVNSSGSYSEKTIYGFSGSSTDGMAPEAGLLTDSSGNLYGTTSGNGGSTAPLMGTVFKLSSVLPAGAAPVVTGVVNGASFQAGIVAGSWVTIQGTNFTPANFTDTWDKAIVDGKLPTTLDGVSVSVGGQAAYPYYISATQINVVAPNVGTGKVQVTVENASGTSAAFTASVNAVQPAFFLFGGKYAVATHTDGTPAVGTGVIAGLTTTPAKPGEYVVLWGTGFGPTSPAATPGIQVPSDQIYSTVGALTATVNGEAAAVYGGAAALAPGFAGLYQMAVQIPADAPDGDLPIVVTIGGVKSPDGVMVTVQH